MISDGQCLEKVTEAEVEMNESGGRPWSRPLACNAGFPAGVEAHGGANAATAG